MSRRARLCRWKGMCGCCERTIEYHPKANLYIFEQDHFLPLSMGGPDIDANMWPLCLDCHRRKTQMESKRKFTTPWCPICEAYYQVDSTHPCFGRIRIARGVAGEPRVILPCKTNLVHPDEWLLTFGYQDCSGAKKNI